jgi:tetratricopeptide (TPR) repeat protein
VKLWATLLCGVSLWLIQPATQNPVFQSVDLREWLGAALEHEPGVEDAALRRIAGWPGGRLVRALEAAQKESSTDQLNHLLERAALLHGDIVILRQDANPGWPDAPGIGGTSVMTHDGQRLGQRALDPHLQFARMIFRVMRSPLPGDASAAPAWAAAHRRNPRVQQWYRTISTELAARHWLADLRPHLEDARRVLDDTPATLFDSACFSEVIASAQVQRAVQSSVSASAPPSVRLRAKAQDLLLDERFNLSEAERFYRETLELDPGYSEARVRLARVLSLRGRGADAVALFATPIESPDTLVRYWGGLAFGQAAEAVDKPAVARDAYARAANLFPRAQSPLLALLRLARERADAAEAKQLMDRLARLPAEERTRFDPWWDYFDCHGRFRDEERERLWALYREKGPQ